MTFRSLELVAAATGLAVLVVVPGVVLGGQATRGKPALMNPGELNERAPDLFKANFDTSAGPFVIEVHRDWSPNGADRFYNLAKRGYYDGLRFFRVIPGFMAQFGISGDPSISKVWRAARIADDPVTQSNRRGYITFATAGPGTRTTQLFINLADNNSLDKQGFSPFGQVASGMDNVQKIYSGYGEGAPSGKGPDQGRVQMEGNKYLEAEFPRLDYIKTITIAQ
jgi:peptidyl-prolyl cis-trans isomerase A (cyclophilin A)